MKRYAAYKPTGLKWFPEIPQEWNWRFLCQVAQEQTIKKPPEEMYPVMTLSYGEIKRKKNIDSGLVPSNYDNYQMLYKGNIVLRLIDLQNDHTSLRTGLVHETGIITSAYTCIVSSENPAYIRYLLHSYDTRKVFYGYGGGVRQSIGFKEIRHLQVSVPPRDEQDQIVRYLDWQVSKINRLIAAKRKQIELLKEHKEAFINTAVTRGIVGDIPLKESGMQWLPKIPAHWKPVPAKALFRNISELRHEDDPMLAATQKYGLIEQAEYMRRENRRIVLANDNLDKWLHVEPNDFIISLRSFQGGLEKCDKPGCVTWHYVVLRPQQYVYSPFYKWFFKSASYIGALQKTSDFIRDGQDLRFSNFAKVGLFVIPMAEQVKIADRLDSEIPKYQKAIDTLEKEIQQIIEYRIRLISDVVTGQIDVRGVEVPDFIYTEDTDSKQMDEAEEYMGVK